METASRRPTLESVAGAVHLEPDAAAALLRNLELRGLVTYASGDLRLTPDGRSRAAQVIRAHRLWETHLAEDTGIGETEWHALAEQQEHSISPAEADALAARLSHPTHDPHGDPIPSAEGDLPAESGQALNTLAPGSVARIIHIEDEPAVLYSQLVAMNLRAGMTVQVAESGRESLRFSADGAMHEIAPMLAHQIEVILLAGDDAAETRSSLADYPPGRRVTVRGLARGARGPERSGAAAFARPGLRRGHRGRGGNGQPQRRADRLSGAGHAHRAASRAGAVGVGGASGGVEIMNEPPPTLPVSAACADCTTYRAARLKKLGLDLEKWDFVVALAGNPNVGKSTVFNSLTGLRQHTGNWPGKTVARAEGGFEFGGKRFKLVDLPGTYSLMAGSPDEEVARDFILFGEPEVTVVVVDASRLERNLNLALQVLEITDRVVVCLNLVDEARRRGLEIDVRRLSRDLGVPVVATSARFGEGLPDLLQAIEEVATGRYVCQPHRLQTQPKDLRVALVNLTNLVADALPGLPNGRWVAMRLLDGDESISTALRDGGLGNADQPADAGAVATLLEAARTLRQHLGTQFHERLVESIYADAARLADRAVTRPGVRPRFDFDRAIDRVVTSRIWGFPIMVLLFALMFWLTISGANYPSRWLSAGLLDTAYPALQQLTLQMGWPWWLRGLLVDGMYLATAWVVCVMLPPMAIFFPLFTLLEDLGYLPRVAFNMDGLFKKAGAHGKQAMTMMMGFGCNAAGVVATRIIDSPRERLIAIITNNFSLCNGRWPTQILVASLFIGTLVPAHLAGVISAMAVMGIAGLGVLLTFITSWALSRTMLKGEPSVFSLELPPYRPPRVLRTIYTSLIERTLIVLWRAVVFALPAGAVIWLSANIHVGGISVAEHVIGFLDPFGLLIGLNGVILLAYLVAIPANEIVIPTVLMMTVLTTGITGVGRGAGVMFEMQSQTEFLALLHGGGWTLLTAVNLMLFSLVHNPCSTTVYTIYKETRNLKWTALATLLPLALGFGLTFAVAQLWRLAGG